MKKTIIILTLIFSSISIYAASSSIIFPYMSIGLGARALGIGSAFSAIADDSSALYWNSAGLAQIKQPEITLTYDKWFMDTYYQYLSGAFPIQTGVLGINLFYMNFGEFEQRDESGILLDEKLNPMGIGGAIGYGMQVIDNLLIGIAANFISQTISESNDFGFSVDAGLIYKMGLLKIAVNIQNIGTGDEFSLPMNIKSAISLEAVSNKDHKLLIGFGSEYAFEDVSSANIGAEYLLLNTIFLRAGYEYKFSENQLEELSGFSLGTGFKLEDFYIDYAFIPYGELGFTHRASLTYKFGEQL